MRKRVIIQIAVLLLAIIVCCNYNIIDTAAGRIEGNEYIIDEDDIWSEYDIIVAQDGSGDYKTIQAACDAANYGDSIYIKNGTYNEHVVAGDSSDYKKKFLVYLMPWEKNLTLVGQSKSSTVIYYDGDESPLTMNNGTIKNLTLESRSEKPALDASVRISGVWSKTYGAEEIHYYSTVVNSTNNYNLTVEDCRIIGNVGINLKLHSGDYVYIESCTFQCTDVALSVKDDGDEFTEVPQLCIFRNNVTGCVDFYHLQDGNTTDLYMLQNTFWSMITLFDDTKEGWNMATAEIHMESTAWASSAYRFAQPVDINIYRYDWTK